MKKVLHKLKAAFSRGGRRRRREDNRDKDEDARVADLQLWVRVSFCFRLLRGTHIIPQPNHNDIPAGLDPTKCLTKSTEAPIMPVVHRQSSFSGFDFPTLF